MLKLEVANLALGRLGVSFEIVNYNESTNQAKIVRRHFRMSLDTLLEKHDWTFTSKIAALTLSSENPEAVFRYVYNIPSDAHVIREIGEENKLYHVERYEDYKIKWDHVYGASGPKIQTNLPDAFAKYTVRLIDDYDFPVFFGRALSAQLALDIAPSLITNNFGKVKQELLTTVYNDINAGIAYDMGRQPLKADSHNPFVLTRE